MALDGLFLHFLSNQLKERAVGTRIEKIHQPTKEELVFILRGRSGAGRLLLSCRADSPRIHYTKYAPENPQSPPMLCMLLRKHLSGARLVEIRQPGLERILFLDFDATNELGDPVRITVVIEIMARHSNIIILDQEGTIMDAVKRIDLTMSSVRQILPGLAYVLPPSQDKKCLLTNTNEEIFFSLQSYDGSRLSKALQNTLQGVSPIVCRELAYHSCFGDDLSVGELTQLHKNRLAEKFDDFRRLLQESDLAAQAALERGETASFLPNAVIVDDQTGKPKDFSFFPITQYGDAVNQRPYQDLSELLDEFFAERVRIDRARSRSQDLLKLLSNTYERTSRRINAQREELKQCENRETLRIYGDIINANLHTLERGASYYDLVNFYDDNRPVRIPANPALSPTKNAQKYYKDYRKAHTAAKMLVGFIEQGEEELKYLETVTDALSRADSDRDVTEIREELISQGYIKKCRSTRQKQTVALPPKEYRSADGYTILVGRNNRQNDQLTLKKASKMDFWFHAKNIAGSHVIVVANGEVPPDTTLEQAAVLAAYHSKGRQSPTVAVDYTQVKNVKKPSGAKPGMVIYDNYKTVLVRPEEHI